jgi:two-component system, cell cycle sensor histidine kinase PleC
VSASETQPPSESGQIELDPNLPWPVRVLPQQLALLHAAMPAALLAQFGMVVAAVFVLWSEPTRTQVLTWAAALTLVTGARLALYRSWPQRPLSVEEAPRWRSYIVLGAFMSGTVWGALPVLLGPGAPLEYQMFLGVVIAGMSAGALAALSYLLPAFYAFVVPALIPFALVMLIGEGPIRTVLGGLSLFFLVLLAFIARRLEQAVVRAFRLQHQNAALAKRLMIARDAASAAVAAKNDLIAHLEESRREAESANQAKSMFLAIMSHELRTPLNAIIGFADIIRSEALGPVHNPRYREYVNDIRDSGTHLLELINKILDLSKIEAGKFELLPDRIELAPMMRSVFRLFREQATAAGVVLEVQIEPEASWLVADERAVKQMLINLISNALKFAPRGSPIRVTAASVSGGIEIVVTDQGVGIDSADVAKAMAPFSQLGDPMTRRHEGTGLGLTLVKSLVELHRGTVAIDSAVGQGTAVRLFLPQAPEVVAPPGSHAAPVASEGRP